MKRPEGFESAPVQETRREEADAPHEASDSESLSQAEAEPAPRRWALADYVDSYEVDDEVEAPSRGSIAQRVDREWRAKRREQDRDGRALAREAKRAAKAASRERRRVERAEVRRFTANSRRRLRTTLLVIGAGVLTLALLVGLVWSPLMIVREVRVEGADRLDASTVEDSLQEIMGRPLATVTEERVAERLAEIPQIQSYRVDIVPPSSVVVHIVERTPVAVVTTPNGDRVIDPAGVELGEAGPDAADLPRLGQMALDSPEFEAVAEVLVSVPPSVLETTSTIEAVSPSDIRMTLASGQVVQWGGPEESPLKADVVAALLSTQDATTARVLDVRAPERPVVRTE